MKPTNKQETPKIELTEYNNALAEMIKGRIAPDGYRVDRFGRTIIKNPLTRDELITFTAHMIREADRRLKEIIAKVEDVKLQVEYNIGIEMNAKLYPWQFRKRHARDRVLRELNNRRQMLTTVIEELRKL